VSKSATSFGEPGHDAQKSKDSTATRSMLTWLTRCVPALTGAVYLGVRGKLMFTATKQ